MPAASRPVALLALCASLAFTVALLFLVEFVAGFFAEPIHPQEIPGDAVSRTVTWLELNPAPLVRDADLLWRNKPGATKTQLVNPMAFGRKDQWTIENNSRGFRGPELDVAGEAFRILCVGDSITFGFSVDQGDSFPRQLEALLAQRFPAASFEVINAGVPGWSWVQGLRFLDLHGEELDADLIVMGHGTNDQLFPAKVTDEERFSRVSSPLQRTFQRLAILAAGTNTYRAFARGLPEKPEDVESPGCREQRLRGGGCRRVSVEQIAGAVREASRLADSLGADLLVANTDFVETPAVQGVRHGVDRDGIPFEDLVEEFRRRRRTDEGQRSARLGLAPAGGPEAAVEGKAVPDELPAKPVVLRVLVPDPEEDYRVAGSGYFRPHYTLESALYDDATHGDEVAGDGVFSAIIEVPAAIPAIEYKYFQGETGEFQPVPPLASTLGDRVLQVPGSRIGPVDVFGQSLFMVERAHPNRDGHQLIAELIADRLEEFPSFRDHVRRGGEAGDAAAGRTRE